MNALNGPDRHSADLLAAAAGHASITPDALHRMIAHCRGALPDEACGLLAFDEAKPANTEEARTPHAIHVNTVHSIRNASSFPARSFEFDPKDWIRVLYEMQKNRQSLVGFYHSHPRSAPTPSAADIAGLRHVSAGTCWIVSLADPDRPLIKPYRITDDGRFMPLMLAQISV
jgi:proteasome lid subunit RPN8/RPN11